MADSNKAQAEDALRALDVLERFCNEDEAKGKEEISLRIESLRLIIAACRDAIDV